MKLFKTTLFILITMTISLNCFANKEKCWKILPFFQEELTSEEESDSVYNYCDIEFATDVDFAQFIANPSERTLNPLKTKTENRFHETIKYLNESKIYKKISPYCSEEDQEKQFEEDYFPGDCECFNACGKTSNDIYALDDQVKKAYIKCLQNDKIQKFLHEVDNLLYHLNKSSYHFLTLLTSIEKETESIYDTNTILNSKKEMMSNIKETILNNRNTNLTDMFYTLFKTLRTYIEKNSDLITYSSDYYRDSYEYMIAYTTNKEERNNLTTHYKNLENINYEKLMPNKTIEKIVDEVLLEENITGDCANCYIQQTLTRELHNSILTRQNLKKECSTIIEAQIVLTMIDQIIQYEIDDNEEEQEQTTTDEL